MEDYPRTFIKMNTLHLCVPVSCGPLRTQGRYAFRCPNGEMVEFIILNDTLRDVYIYSLTIFNRDPTEFVRTICGKQDSVLVELVDANGIPVPEIKRVEIKAL